MRPTTGILESANEVGICKLLICIRSTIAGYHVRREGTYPSGRLEVDSEPEARLQPQVRDGGLNHLYTVRPMTEG
jgi:hypothetical protein